jgi:hypothetical protein
MKKILKSIPILIAFALLAVPLYNIFYGFFAPYSIILSVFVNAVLSAFLGSIFNFIMDKIWDNYKNKPSESKVEFSNDQMHSILGQISVNSDKALSYSHSLHNNKSLTSLNPVDLAKLNMDKVQTKEIISIIDTTIDINKLISRREDLILKMNPIGGIANTILLGPELYLINNNLKEKIDILVKNSYEFLDKYN